MSIFRKIFFKRSDLTKYPDFQCCSSSSIQNWISKFWTFQIWSYYSSSIQNFKFQTPEFQFLSSYSFLLKFDLSLLKLWKIPNLIFYFYPSSKLLFFRFLFFLESYVWGRGHFFHLLWKKFFLLIFFLAVASSAAYSYIWLVSCRVFTKSWKCSEHSHGSVILLLLHL